MSIWRGTGDGNLMPPSAIHLGNATTSGLAAGDFDGDGIVDLVTTESASDSVVVLLGQPGGTFVSEGTYSCGKGPQFVAAADLDWDGKLDLVTANQTGNTVSVLINQKPTPWSKVGAPLLGSAGYPSLIGAGPLTPGSSGALTLSAALPTSPAVLLLALTSTPAPFKGGTLVPVPVLSALPFATPTTGTIPFAWSSWPAGLSGLSFYFQYAIEDAGAVHGVSLSNAVKALVP